MEKGKVKELPEFESLGQDQSCTILVQSKLTNLTNSYKTNNLNLIQCFLLDCNPSGNSLDTSSHRYVYNHNLFR